MHFANKQPPRRLAGSAKLTVQPDKEAIRSAAGPSWFDSRLPLHSVEAAGVSTKRIVG